MTNSTSTENATPFDKWWDAYVNDGRESLSSYEQDVARDAWNAAQKREPNGYAVVGKDGFFIGIWKDRESAEIVASKHPKADVRPTTFA